MANPSHTWKLLERGYKTPIRIAPGFTLKMGVKGGQLFRNAVSDLQRRGIQRILAASSWNVANAYAAMLRSAYGRSVYKRSESTLATYAMGYDPGEGAKSEPRRKWGSTRPFNRSGALAKAVEVAKGMKHGSETVWAVRFKNVTYGQLGMGDPHDAKKHIAWVAEQLEDPRPVLISATPSMIGYLMMALRGSDHPGTSLKVGDRVLATLGLTRKKLSEQSNKKRVIAYIPPKKPVISRVNKRIRTLYPLWANAVKKYTSDYLNALTRGHKSKPIIVVRRVPGVK